MATVSFDEKVVITDQKIVAEMKKDLDNPSPAIIERKTNTERITIAKAEANAKKWILK